MAERPFHVLVLCTGNSARSILAEATLNHLGEGRVRAFSAGSRPTGKVNPHALALLCEEGIAVEGLRSKSWDEFEAPGAPPIDLVVTVCASAAGETCPIWPGHPLRAHWGVDDPAAVTGDAAAQRAAFAEAYAILRRRIEQFLQLPLHELDATALGDAVRAIGRS